MNTCTHENYEPVEVNSGGFGGLFDLFGDITVVVANICTDCHEQLPVWWGCKDCETVELTRKVSEPTPRLLLARACRRHQEVL